MKPVFIVTLFLLLVAGMSTGCQLFKAPSTGNLLQTVQNRHLLIVGTKYDSPPFGYLDADGKLKGLDIDLAHELARRLLGDPSRVRFVQVSSATRIAALNAKQIDLIIATMTITPKRAEVVNFTHP